MKKVRGLVIISALVLLILGSTVLTAFAASSNEESASNSGFVGISGPSFSFGVVEAATGTTGGANIPDNSPWAITGFYLYTFEGGIYVWVSSASTIALQAGVVPGQIIQVYCSDEQVKHLKAGDWVQVTGVTARGRLVRVGDIVLPQPFSY